MVTRDDEKEIVFNILNEEIVNLAFHPKGNYVLMLAMDLFKDDRFDFIVE